MKTLVRCDISLLSGFVATKLFLKSSSLMQTKRVLTRGRYNGLFLVSAEKAIGPMALSRLTQEGVKEEES